jgi:uncharacterized protein YecE (DUF72 family)
MTREEWRERRRIRREKQRAGNLLRAIKMREARLAGTPDEKPAAGADTPFLNVGCSGWFYWDWRGRFYPNEMPTKNWFSHYVRNFKTVELNAPFYSWPTVQTVQTWRRQAGKRQFIYTVKVCELITHIKRFRGTKKLIADFSFIADILGPAMGCFLFQLPPSFKYSQTRLSLILGQLDHNRRNVIEFRHASWWNDTVFTAFRKTGTIFCSCSGPGLPDVLVKTADEHAYVRFHGTKRWYRHDYSDHELIEWTQQLRESKVRHIWAYFNNDRDGFAIKNAKTLLKQLKYKNSSVGIRHGNSQTPR